MITLNGNGMDAKTLRAVAEMLQLAAEEAEKGTLAAIERQRATGEGRGFVGNQMQQNFASGWGPLPDGLVTKENPYGTRADIGSPGNQVMLRVYARRQGLPDRNSLIKGAKLTPLWPDDDQPWEEQYK